MKTVRSKDGTTIAYDSYGDGPAVILVGGAFSYRAFPKLVELAELLAERFTVINYDRRGRGESSDTPPYAVEREVEDLEALIDASGTSASLWGWSSGAVLALRAAARGVPIDKIAAYEPPFIVEPAERVPPADFRERLDELVAGERRSEATRYFMTRGMGVPPLIVTAMRITPFWSRLKAVAHTLPYDWAVLGNTMTGTRLAPDEWAGIRTPTLVMAGAKSPAQLRRAAEALVDVLPNAELQLLAGQSHNPSMAAVAPPVGDFFAGAGDRLESSAAR